MSHTSVGGLPKLLSADHEMELRLLIWEYGMRDQ